MTGKPKQEPEILNPRYAGATPEAVVLALTRRRGKFEDFEMERESERGVILAKVIIPFTYIALL